MTDWPKLIADLEAWKPGQPSRELADRVLLAWGWSQNKGNVGVWNAPNGSYVRAECRPNPLESMDAAMAGVPEELCWRYDSALGYAELFDLTRSPVHVAGSSEDPCLGSYAAPHALTIAICRARQEMGG